jgi:NAD(P)-dependent dehydrogenase (short-subunit alcohol dehydrogenase family)
MRTEEIGLCPQFANKSAVATSAGSGMGAATALLLGDAAYRAAQLVIGAAPNQTPNGAS